MSDPTLSPYLTVHDGEAAVAFYQAAFGAEILLKLPAADGQRLMHAALALNGGTLMLSDEFPESGDTGGTRSPNRMGGTSVTIHLDVPDADAAFERAVNAGATAIMPLDNVFWGARYGKLRDPFGHVWSIAGPQT